MEIYTCHYCNKKYKRKYYYNNHIIQCKSHNLCKNNNNIYDTKSIDNDSIEFDKININTENLFKLFINLTNKYDKLQKDYNELKQFSNVNKNKLDIIQYLNNNFLCRDYDFTDFCQDLSNNIIISDLEFIFKHDYVNGIGNILINFIEKIKFKNINHIPLYGFNHKDGIIYIYDNTQLSWIQMNEKFLNYLIKQIDKVILKLFLEWKINNENKFLDEQFSEIYVLNMKKIVGNNYDKRNKNIMIKNIIYKHIRVSIKNVFEL
tara:strand:- start:12985 stop:13770 length:786 start_codon:yes stop_codon:yes gene_type:complete